MRPSRSTGKKIEITNQTNQANQQNMSLSHSSSTQSQSTNLSEFSLCIENLENIKEDEFKLLCSKLNEADSNERVRILLINIYIKIDQSFVDL